jgi:HK97 family phage prohead protease
MTDFDHERPEQRSVTFTEAELTGNRFEGYAAVFDQVADLGDFTEEVDRGAFRKVLADKPNVPLVLDHNQSLPPLATTGANTLRLIPDARGLRVEADLDDDHFMTPTLKSMIRRGEVHGMSFGFIAGPGNSRMEQRGDRPHRVITNFRVLTDISPTWRPAYEGTTAEVRSTLGEYDGANAEVAFLLGQMAEHAPAPEWRLKATDLSQPADGGAHPQPDAGAKQDTNAGAGVDEEEQRNAEAVQAAARRRELHRLGLLLPADLRPTIDERHTP